MQVSNKPLPRGLYLGYLKMKSSVDLIRVLVPKDAPNLLPHAKIRDNPWVSRYANVFQLAVFKIPLKIVCIFIILVKSGSGSRNWPKVNHKTKIVTRR
jgi:hypothetical protein